MKIAGFHRLTLAFSRKLVNLEAAVVLYFWFYFLTDSSLSPHDAGHGSALLTILRI